MEQLKDSKGLTVEEAGLLTLLEIRRAAAKEWEDPDMPVVGKTVGEIINEERTFQTDARAKEDARKKVAAEAKTKAAALAAEQRKVREGLLEELRPVALKNCTIKRYGSEYDGGYLMCENLIKGVESAYSYGIDTEDNWGCQMTRNFGVIVHQYDCFTPYRPACDGGRFMYHNECIGPKTETIDKRLFDTLAKQISKNGDSGKRLVVKMDIEAAEWDSLLATPDEVLNRIDQLPMELHGVNEPRFLELVRKLKRTFVPVSIHFNNHACTSDADPLPGWAYQVLFVNKRLAVVDPSRPGRVPGSAPDAPDDPAVPDCQQLPTQP